MTDFIEYYSPTNGINILNLNYIKLVQYSDLDTPDKTIITITLTGDFVLVEVGELADKLYKALTKKAFKI